MCGLVGYLGSVACSSGVEPGVLLQQMADSIISRGPDDSGIWIDKDAAIGLAHRRLSIIDLSPAGHQPMASASGRYVIAFNGEIYNHLEIRTVLDKAGLAPTWRGHSDTETLLAGFSAWGIKATLELCIGMFAFAMWDRETRALTLGRDRLGEKPLYYGWQGIGERTCFLFGSELKALKLHPSFTAEIDRGALSLLMRHNYVPGPYSVYKGMHKLQPGCLLTVSLEKRDPTIKTYWSLAQTAIGGNRDPFLGSAGEAVDQLEALLKSSVQQQMMADVPLGAFLSGGVDSSTVVALMQAQSARPVKTFTIGFNEEGYNEATYAKAVAKHLGADHTELYVTPQQAMDVIPKLPTLYSEPFADSSQIPTFLVSQLARSKVTVSLSGDGGDELFAGYNRYTLACNVWRKLGRLPSVLRSGVAAGIRSMQPVTWDKLFRYLRYFAPQLLHQANMGDKLHKAAGVLSARNIDELYLRLVSHWEPEDLVIGGYEPPTFLRGNSSRLDGLDEVQRMMVLDTITYLPDDILAKVDRAAMGVSLEGRVPFLDHRVVEFAWRLPQSMKLRDGVGKWALRQILYRYVPKELIERPKMGFGVPIDSWLRDPLRDWAESLLEESRLRQEGYFNPQPIRERWKEHLSGKRNWQYQLWNVLMFQAWLEAGKH